MRSEVVEAIAMRLSIWADRIEMSRSSLVGSLPAQEVADLRAAADALSLAPLLDEVREVLRESREMHRMAADALPDEHGEPHRQILVSIDDLLAKLGEAQRL